MLASHRFNPDDQLRFARLTGDVNPIHMDPVFARRTLAGTSVVHGVHALLWLLDCIAGARLDLPMVSALKVRFLRMMEVGETAHAEITSLDPKSLHAEVTVGGGVAVEMKVLLAPPSAELPKMPAGFEETAGKPRTTEKIEDMAGMAGGLPTACGIEKYATAFPHATRYLGLRRVAALGQCSYLIGMVVPGTHSLFSALTLKVCADSDPARAFTYRVKSAHPLFRLVDIDIVGGGWSGLLQAFVRHPPTSQPAIRDVSALVSTDEFSGARVLIIGGSRGLGALTANIIAAGGGQVTVSYVLGKAEAETLAADINAAGGCCRIQHYDVRKSADDQLALVADQPTHIYYFATPQIFFPKSNGIDWQRFDLFNAYYLSGFHRIAQAAARRCPEGVRIFFPPPRPWSNDQPT
ncbi:MAG: MaoC/PaaZ C-terminal domain-containing protein [Rhodospirillales bacterium]|jgi:hypothetical protein|nr:MaoC/PaaZ C-terminal domain-containing protein [Rhodospirillales bacterium]